MHTCSLQQEAYFRAMKQLANECKHAPKLYATKVDMAGKAQQKESCKQASWFTSYKQHKMQQHYWFQTQ